MTWTANRVWKPLLWCTGSHILALYVYQLPISYPDSISDVGNYIGLFRASDKDFGWPEGVQAGALIAFYVLVLYCSFCMIHSDPAFLSFTQSPQVKVFQQEWNNGNNLGPLVVCNNRGSFSCVTIYFSLRFFCSRWVKIWYVCLWFLVFSHFWRWVNIAEGYEMMKGPLNKEKFGLKVSQCEWPFKWPKTFSFVFLVAGVLCHQWSARGATFGRVCHWRICGRRLIT